MNSALRDRQRGVCKKWVKPPHWEQRIGKLRIFDPADDQPAVTECLVEEKAVKEVSATSAAEVHAPVSGHRPRRGTSPASRNRRRW